MPPLLQPARSTRPLTAAASGSTTLLVRWRRTSASPGRLSATARILGPDHPRRGPGAVREAGRLVMDLVCGFRGLRHAGAAGGVQHSAGATDPLPCLPGAPRRWHEILGSFPVSDRGTGGRSCCGATGLGRPGSEIYGGPGSGVSPVWARKGADGGGPGSYPSVAGCQSVRAVIDQVSGVTETTPSQATARMSLSGSSSSGSTTVRICSRTGSASARVPGGRYT